MQDARLEQPEAHPRFFARDEETIEAARGDATGSAVRAERPRVRAEDPAAVRATGADQAQQQRRPDEAGRATNHGLTLSRWGSVVLPRAGPMAELFLRW